MVTHSLENEEGIQYKPSHLFNSKLIDYSRQASALSIGWIILFIKRGKQIHKRWSSKILLWRLCPLQFDYKRIFVSCSWNRKGCFLYLKDEFWCFYFRKKRQLSLGCCWLSSSTAVKKPKSKENETMKKIIYKREMCTMMVNKLQE